MVTAAMAGAKRERVKSSTMMFTVEEKQKMKGKRLPLATREPLVKMKMTGDSK